MAVTVDDIATELGRATSDLNASQIERWIAAATTLISLRAKEHGTTLADLDPAVVDMVVAWAVVAMVRNPDNATQVQVSVDDASTSRTYSSGYGRVNILGEWWELLGLGGGKKQRIWAADTIATTSANHIPWCNLPMGGTYCSCGTNLTAYEYPLYEGGVLSPGGGYYP